MRPQATNRIAGCAIPFSVACGVSFVCLAMCGSSLALFFAGFFILTLLLPPMVLSQSSHWNRLAIAACAIGGVFIAWLVAAVQSELITGLQFARCIVVLISYATLIAGMALMLLRMRLNPLFASAITTLIGLAWLTWPVWLVPNLPESPVNVIVDSLVRFHPLFAVNGALMDLGAWSHWPFVYRKLSTLGQDIPYSLPQSILPAFAVHLLAGIAMIAIYQFTAECSGKILVKSSGASM